MIDYTFDDYRKIIDQHISDFLPDIDHKSITLYDSMKYSIEAGGKRIRPVLLLAACNFCGGSVEEALPYACAVEYIHTYTLIHDDLPCMDDDDMRRGIPSNHKVYGDAIATLAGDGLQSAAYEIMGRDMLIYFDDPERLKKRAAAAYEITKGAGCRGVIGGQVADIETQLGSCSNEMLDFIHLNKTAALIIASVRAGARLGDPDDQKLSALSIYAENLGLAFQIADDILDVVGSEDEMGKRSGMDSAHEKVTYASIHGIDSSKEQLKKLTENAVAALASYYDNAEFFTGLAMDLADRRK